MGFRQGKQMIQQWYADGSKGVSTVQQDTRTLALNVLAYAAFGKEFDFYGNEDSGSHKNKPQGPLSYRDALAIILHNALLLLLLGQKTVRKLSWVPGLGPLSEANDRFQEYMTEMWAERSTDDHDGKARGNFISSLVRASSEDKLDSTEEVIGNIFVVNFAGHDTTAHSFAFTFMLLAWNIEVQKWMAEEIRYFLNGRKDVEHTYELFPKMKRTLAVLVNILVPVSTFIANPDHSSRLYDFTTRFSVS
jgi:cytochrome P450